ncbi:MAG: histidine kinase dimerization/phospho-acceptor domain-containing protein, partial [Acidobacteriota bacterium]|nr:histidine kinase dimerization/phospho-acceptor domain-containing protein [Acidobacteriota bacterium]
MNEPGAIGAILFALPPAMMAGVTVRRWLRDRRRGRQATPRWTLAGLCVWATIAAAAVAIPLPWPLPGLFDGAGEGLARILGLEALLTVALVTGWLLDDAARRHRHLHLLESASQRRLRQTERSFAALVEAIPEAVIVVSTTGLEILATNAFARRWLGREEEPHQPVPLAQWLAPEESGDLQALLAKVCERSAARPQPLRFRRADGTTVEAEVVGASLLFRDRPAMALVARDVSAAEQALRAAQALSRAKDRLLTHVSYEVRTPLSGIFGTCEFLLDDDPHPALREGLETIQRCAGDLLLTVDDVLDFSRLEAGQFELLPTVFEPAAIVEEVCQHLSPGP